ncbi:MAG: hypothetical protein ACLR23_04905 [Clostridia bacterium]
MTELYNKTRDKRPPLAPRRHFQLAYPRGTVVIKVFLDNSPVLTRNVNE